MKKTKLGKLLQGKAFKFIGDVAIGAISPTKPIVGMIAGLSEGIKDIKKKNLDSEAGGVGKVNVAQIVGYLLIALIALYFFGVIDKETFDLFTEKLNDVE